MKIIRFLYKLFGFDIYLDRRFTNACEHGDLKTVKYFVKKGADVRNGDDWAFRSACYNGHLDIVKYLVENGADVDACGGQAFRWACGMDRLGVVKYLIETGVDVNTMEKLVRCCVGNNESGKFLLNLMRKKKLGRLLK